jgi:hypothetical protein
MIVLKTQCFQTPTRLKRGVAGVLDLGDCGDDSLAVATSAGSRRFVCHGDSVLSSLDFGLNE